MTLREPLSKTFSRTSKRVIFLVLTASLVSGHSQKSPARNRHIYNFCIIYDLFLFSFSSAPRAHHQIVQAPGTCTHSTPPAPGSSIPGQSLPELPSCQPNWHCGFQEENVIPHRKACLAYRLFCQVETPSSLVTKAEEKLRDSSTEL